MNKISFIVSLFIFLSLFLFSFFFITPSVVQAASTEEVPRDTLIESFHSAPTSTSSSSQSTPEVRRGPTPLEIEPRWIEETSDNSSTQEVTRTTENTSAAEAVPVVAVSFPTPVHLIQTGTNENIALLLFSVLLMASGAVIGRRR